MFRTHTNSKHNQKTYGPLLKNYTITYNKLLIDNANLFAEGSTSKIFNIQYDDIRESGAEYALKVYLKPFSQSAKPFLEPYFISQISSPYVIKLKSITYLPGQDAPAMMTKRYTSSLQAHLQNQQAFIPLQQICQWGLQLSNGLNDIHEQKLLHRDLNLENIFYDNEENTLIIGDFNEACLQSASEVNVKALEMLTIDKKYCAPEILKSIATKKSIKLTTECDIYSLGVVLSRLATHSSFVNESKPQNIPDYDSRLKHLIQQCLEENPKKRISAKDLSFEFKSFLQALKTEDAKLINSLQDPTDFKTEVKTYGPLLKKYIFPYTELERTSDVILGEGSTGIAVNVRHNNKEYVGKIFNKRRESFFHEALIMSLMHHPNLLRLEGLTYDDSDLIAPILLTERCASTLQQFLQKETLIADAEQLYQWAIQLAGGLSALHHLDLIHNDLRASNIYIKQNQTLVIGDFSETCSQTTGEFLPNITVDKAKATKASDIYSLGLVLWEMVTRVPFEKLFDQDKKLLNCPSVLEKCIQQCLSKDPLFRPTAEALSLELKSALRDLQQKNRELLCMTLDRRDFKEAKEIYHGALQCYLYKEAPPLEEALGRGSFGRSYAGILQQQKVAVKLCSQGKESLARFYPEALIMKQMNRLKGITYYQRGIDPPIPSIIMKYYPNTLFNIVRDRKESFSTEQLYEWGRQLAAGLKEIHEKRLLHRDLRSANIFVDEDGKLVIGDFGEASWQTTAESRLGVNYMICAPEVTESLQTPKPLFMTTANDIYALGFILWEMAALPSLWYYTNGIPHSERNVEIDSLNCPSPFKEMIKACLHVNPAKRPSAEGLMRQFENLLHLSDERQNLGEKLEKFLMPNEKKENRGKIGFFKSKSNKLEEEQKPTPHKSCLIC